MSTVKILSAIALMGKAISELGDALSQTAFNLGVPDPSAGVKANDNSVAVCNALPDTGAVAVVNDAPYPTSGWITNRLPDESDADEHGKVWVVDDETGNVIAGNWDGSSVNNDMPWRPIRRPSVHDAGWVYDRRPTLADTGGYGKVWSVKNGDVIMAKIDGSTVRNGARWMTIDRPASPFTEAETRARLAAING